MDCVCSASRHVWFQLLAHTRGIEYKISGAQLQRLAEYRGIESTLRGCTDRAS